MAVIISLLGSVNGGSEFSVLVGNPFVKTPHGLHYKKLIIKAMGVSAKGFPTKIETSERFQASLYN